MRAAESEGLRLVLKTLKPSATIVADGMGIRACATLPGPPISFSKVLTLAPDPRNPCFDTSILSKVTFSPPHSRNSHFKPQKFPKLHTSLPKCHPHTFPHVTNTPSTRQHHWARNFHSDPEISRKLHFKTLHFHKFSPTSLTTHPDTQSSPDPHIFFKTLRFFTNTDTDTLFFTKISTLKTRRSHLGSVGQNEASLFFAWFLFHKTKQRGAAVDTPFCPTYPRNAIPHPFPRTILNEAN